MEIVRPDIVRGRFKAVLFDFDGTLSLIREGWSDIMIDMMVDYLQETKPPETPEQLRHLVEEFVMALNGRPSIFQMARLAEEITNRGYTPLPAETYLEEYDRRLTQKVHDRIGTVRDQVRWAVPGSHELLQTLQEQGLKLYLASGTHLRFVSQEVDYLGLTHFFGKEINAPNGDDHSFSKRAVIDRILSENNIPGKALLSFGDGVVETQEVKKVGGVAIAVASDEPPTGRINQWKRERLIAAGADAVIPDYGRHREWLGWLVAE
jgi:phosphoglycolate phosphatase